METPIVTKVTAGKRVKNQSEQTGPTQQRTQKARRSATIAKLTDAAIEALVELGYTKASTNEICQRAGVSQGALFRHFATRSDFMAHVAEAVLSRKIKTFETGFYSQNSQSKDPIERGVRFTREVCYSNLGRAWMELIMASRTDNLLKEKMVYVYYKARVWTRETAKRIFPERIHDHERFDALVDAVVMMFEMEGSYAHLNNDQEAAERRVEFAIRSYRQFFIDQDATE